MKTRRIMKSAAVGAVVLAVGACTDLDVTNPNEPNVGRALSKASDVEQLIRSQFRVYWSAVQGPFETSLGDEGLTGAAFDGGAEISTSNSFNHGTYEIALIPPAPIPNEVGFPWAEYTKFTWLEFNRGLAAIRNGLRSIEEQNLASKLDSPERLQAFAKFQQGLFHGYIALMYDQGWTLDETVEDPAAIELQPYDQVMQAALGYLAEARSIAQSSGVDMPGGWVGPGSLSNAEFIALTHSYQARFMTAVARSPAERTAVDWSAVLSHIEQGITQDFGVNLDGFGGIWNSEYKGRSAVGEGVYLPLLGPADQSGGYTAWEAVPGPLREPFIVDTDDQRIATPEREGLLTEYRTFHNNIRARGAFFLTWYSPKWWRSISETQNGFAPEVSVQEMDFLAAEAHIRLGNPDAALPAINAARVADGGLPPATVDGVSGDRCVPRAVGPLRKASNQAEGSCGDLMTTLIYEKKMELVQLSGGLAFFDSRGWGVLRTGRPLHIAIPVEDLQVLGVPVYTFGGGGEGSAP